MDVLFTEIAKAIEGLSPVGIVVFGVSVTLIGLFRGWWVPGFIAKRDQERADTLQVENIAHIRTNADCAAELRFTKQKVRDLERVIAELRGRGGDRVRGG